MAIELLNAYDDNPPKVQILPKFELTPRRKRYLKVVGIITLVGGLLFGIMNPRHFFSGFMSAFYLMLFIQVIIGFFWLNYKYYKMRATNGASVKAQHHIHDYYKKVFTDNGYHISYEAPGILIDNDQKKIGFTITGAGYDTSLKRFTKMLVCDYAYMRTWETNSKEITERVGGRLKHSEDPFSGYKTSYVTPSYERTMVTLYRVNVTINYPDNPLQSFEATSESDAKQWVARLSSLING